MGFFSYRKSNLTGLIVACRLANNGPIGDGSPNLATLNFTREIYEIRDAVEKRTESRQANLGRLPRPSQWDRAAAYGMRTRFV